MLEDREESLKDLPAQELTDKHRRPAPFHVIINPQITLTGNDEVPFYEGCLSLNGFSAVVPRARTVRVDYSDEQGEPRSAEASGWYARILQHEIDHLHGTLYLDRMQTRAFTSIDNRNRFWKGKPIGEPSPAQLESPGTSTVFGGAGRNRTADEGFADPCLATWPPRLLLFSLGRRSA